MRVVDRIGNHPVPVIAELEALGGIASRFRRHLHQADRICRRLVALVERAFGARHRINHAVLDFGGELTVRRNPDGGKGVMVERQSAAERGLSDLQHRAGVVAAAGQLAERFEQGHIRALFAEIGGKIEHDIALADLVEHFGGAHAFVRGRSIGGREIGRGRAQFDLVTAELGARQLAVIGGRVAGGRFIARTHRIRLAKGFGRASAPVVRPRQHDRIGRAVVDMGEMRGRGFGIVEVAERDPAAHEVDVGPVIFIGRRRGGADHIVGGLELALIEQLAGERAPLAPPLIGVLQRHRLRRGRQHQAGRVVNAVLGEHPLDAAQGVAEILPCLDCDIVERILRLVRFSLDRGTGLHDRKLVVAEALRGALRAGEILGADAPVHARTVVIAVEKVAERLERVGLQALRQFVRSPCVARQPGRAVPIAFSEQHARQRQLALGTCGPIANEAANRRRIAALLPQPRLCAPAQHRRARPLRISGDERRVAAESRGRLRVAQDVPLDELLRRRIRDPVPDVRRLLGLCLAREIDGFLHQRKIARQRSDGLLGSGRSLRRLRLALRGSVLGVPIFSGRSAAMGASLLRRVRLLGRFVRLLGVWLMAGPRGRIRREEGEPSYCEKTRQRA